jgi:hypothetical protein
LIINAQADRDQAEQIVSNLPPHEMKKAIEAARFCRDIITKGISESFFSLAHLFFENLIFFQRSKDFRRKTTSLPIK